MSGIYRRCGCRDENRRQFGVLPVKGATAEQKARTCPKLIADPKHGGYSWRVSAGFDPVTGKRVVVNGKTYPTLKAAQTALNQAKVLRDENRLQGPTKETLASYAAEWLPRRQTTGKRPLAQTTALNYQRYIDQDIAPSRLGKMRLSDIKRSDVQGFLDGLAKAGRGATTVNRILATVQAILTGAVKDEKVSVNVARGVEGPTIERSEKAIWEPAQVAAFLQVAGEHRLGPAFEVALHTALRRGELCGLRWSDIDLDRGIARIAANRVKLDGATLEKAPKTQTSAADVELSEHALAALRVWQLRQTIEREEWGEAYINTGHVFTMEDGRPVDPSYLTRLFGRLSDQTERSLRDQQATYAAERGLSDAEVEAYMEQDGVRLPRLTLHGLRHCAASYMWDATGDLLAVSRALRHSSPAVTAEIYTHMKAGKLRSLFSTIGAQVDGVSVEGQRAAS